MHSKQQIHRDIKPANIFVDKELVGRVIAKLGDLGISKDNQGLEKTGTIAEMGTHKYFSPERLQLMEYGRSSDIWAIGLILYQLLSGRFPFDVDNERKILKNILEEDPFPLPTYVGASITTFVISLLEKDPERRPGIDQIIDVKKLKDIFIRKIKMCFTLADIKDAVDSLAPLIKVQGEVESKIGADKVEAEFPSKIKDFSCNSFKESSDPVTVCPCSNCQNVQFEKVGTPAVENEILQQH